MDCNIIVVQKSQSEGRGKWFNKLNLLRKENFEFVNHVPKVDLPQKTQFALPRVRHIKNLRFIENIERTNSIR